MAAKKMGGGGLGGNLDAAFRIIYPKSIIHIQEQHMVLPCVIKYVFGIGFFPLLRYGVKIGIGILFISGNLQSRSKGNGIINID